MSDLPPSVSLSIGEGGLPVVGVSSAKGTATVHLNGANVTSWIPAGHDPVLWLSPGSDFTPGRPIRGGIPLCLPWFSKGPDGDKEPMHGTARLARWELRDAVDDEGTVTLNLALTQPGWEAALAVTVGDALVLELTTRNTGETDLTVEEALHTYFAVKDVSGIEVRGLDGARYFDKVIGVQATQEGDLVLADRTDRVYENTGRVEIVDPGLGRTISIAKEDSANTVVWNPWAETVKGLADVPDDAWPSFVCVETANVGSNATVLAPGESHVIATEYVVTLH
ncbi:MAG: D-hexose-6-phosphate mutarotase [Actinomycetota bacterium]